MKIKDPNPFNVFGIRKVTYCPPYFEAAYFPFTYNLVDSVERWIDNNLKGRYYVGKTTSLIDNKISNSVKIGFEEPREMSYFMLACPHLKYK